MNKNSLPIYINNIPNTKVEKSLVHGFGLFATKNIRKGTLLCKLSGQILDKKEYEKFQSVHSDKKDFFVGKSTILNNKIFAVPFRTSYSFINHNSSISHIEEIFCEKTNTLSVIAKIDIKKSEEIFDTYNLKNHIDILGGFKK